LDIIITVEEISYITTDEGWLYLSIVKDLFNKEIVGWSASSRMTRELLGPCIEQTISK